MAQSKIKIGTAIIADDENGGLTLSGDIVMANMNFSNGEISSGITTYFDMDAVTDDLVIDGQAAFANPITVPQIDIDNQTGAETCGTATTGLGANVTVTTTAVTTTSVILVTANGTAPAGILYVDNIVNGTSFDIISTSGADTTLPVNWLIINPV